MTKIAAPESLRIRKISPRFQPAIHRNEDKSAFSASPEDFSVVMAVATEECDPIAFGQAAVMQRGND